MPELYNSMVCLRENELTDIGIISASALEKYRNRTKAVVARKGLGKGNHVLLKWDVLRPDLRDGYRRVTKINPAEVAKNLGSLKIETDYAAIDWFANYQLLDGRNLKPAKQKQLVANAQVLNAIIQLRSERMLKRKSRGISTRDMWKGIIEEVKALKSALGHNLQCSNRLRQQVDDYQAQGCISLISAKFMNQHAAKVADTEQEASLKQLLRKHQNLDNEQIRSLYNIIGQALGWKSITAATVGNYREKWELVTHSARKGVSSWDNTRGMQVKRSAPSSPLYYWTVDGWDVELLYQKTEINEKGNSVTTYHNRLSIVVVLDPFNKYPVGYAIGTHETPQLIKDALRNAITHTKELFGDYHKVLQLQTDNYGKKSLASIYEVLSDKYTPARVHNAKSKVIEPYFGYLNKKYCQLMPNWSGFGIASGSANQPNAEYLNKIRHSFPDEFGCTHQIVSIMEQERLNKVAAYRKGYDLMPEEDKKHINLVEFLKLTGATTGFTNRLSAAGLVVTIEGVKHEYDSFDIRFRHLAHVDWTVRYNPGDVTQVLATSEEGHSFLLAEKYVQPMALRDRKEGDADALKQIRQYNSNVKEAITEGMAEDAGTVRTMFENNPVLNGTLAKLVLVDSNGQHKDNKSAARVAAGKARKLIEKQTRNAEVIEQRTWAQEQEEYLKSKVDYQKYLNYAND